MICCYYSNRKRLRISTITTFVRLLLLFKCWPPLSDCRTLIIAAAQSLRKYTRSHMDILYFVDCIHMYMKMNFHINLHVRKYFYEKNIEIIFFRFEYSLANWVLLLAVFTANTTWYFTILLWLENFHQSIFSFSEYSKRIIWNFSFAFVEYGL